MLNNALYSLAKPLGISSKSDAVAALPVISLEIVAGKCASDIVPVAIFVAFKLVNAEPLPLKLVATTVPVTEIPVLVVTNLIFALCRPA